MTKTTHAAYLDEIEPTEADIEELEWMDEADVDEYEGERLSLLYFEEF